MRTTLRWLFKFIKLPTLNMVTKGGTAGNEGGYEKEPSLEARIKSATEFLQLPLSIGLQAIEQGNNEKRVIKLSDGGYEARLSVTLSTTTRQESLGELVFSVSETGFPDESGLPFAWGFQFEPSESYWGKERSWGSRTSKVWSGALEKAAASLAQSPEEKEALAKMAKKLFNNSEYGGKLPEYLRQPVVQKVPQVVYAAILAIAPLMGKIHTEEVLAGKAQKNAQPYTTNDAAMALERFEALPLSQSLQSVADKYNEPVIIRWNGDNTYSVSLGVHGSKGGMRGRLNLGNMVINVKLQDSEQPTSWSVHFDPNQHYSGNGKSESIILTLDSVFGLMKEKQPTENADNLRNVLGGLYCTSKETALSALSKV